MQSTGHSSMHALSLMSTQGSAITYVTRSPQISGPGWGCPVGPVVRNPNLSTVTDTNRCIYPRTSGTPLHDTAMCNKLHMDTARPRLRRVGLAHAILVSLSEQS